MWPNGWMENRQIRISFEEFSMSNLLKLTTTVFDFYEAPCLIFDLMARFSNKPMKCRWGGPEIEQKRQSFTEKKTQITSPKNVVTTSDSFTFAMTSCKISSLWNPIYSQSFSVTQSNWLIMNSSRAQLLIDLIPEESHVWSKLTGE